MKKIRTIEAMVLGCDVNGRRVERLKVCAYCRVSTDQIEQQQSFSAQAEHYTDYIKNNPAWEFAGIYADQGISGKNKAKRPEFMRMVKDAENKKLDLIITKSISRFARNVTDCLETVRKLKSIGVGIYFEKENINTLHAESELMLSILSSIAEEELVSISQNMRWSNQNRFKQGKIMVNTKRFMGYDKDPKGKLLIDEKQAAIVRRIFADYISGSGLSLIAKGLEKDEIQNISGNERWSVSAISCILKNEKYIGDAILQKTVTADAYNRKKNKGDAPMYYVKDSHPAIISREDFEKVEKLMVDRAKSKGNVEGSREKYLNRYALTSTILCNRCGSKFKRHLNNCGNVAEIACWVCNTYINEGRSNCDMGRVKEETIKALFVRVFNRLYTERVRLLGDYRVRLEREKFSRFDLGRMTKLDEEIECLIKQERVLFAIKEKGYADLGLFTTEHEELVSSLTKLQVEREELVGISTKQDSRIARTLELNAIIEAQGCIISEFKDDLYTAIVEKIVIMERTRLVFHLKNGLAFEERYSLKRGRDQL